MQQDRRAAKQSHRTYGNTIGGSRRRHYLQIVTWLLLSTAVTGCASTNPPSAPASYRLELDTSKLPEVPGNGGILQVARPDALAGADSRGIAYRTEPHQLRYYTRSRWADTPARMLQSALISAFEASEIFKAVVSDGRVAADYLLTTQLLRLEQNLSADGNGTTEISMRLQVIALPSHRLLGSRVVEASVANTSRDANGAVAGAHAALAQAMTEAIRFVADAKSSAASAAER